LKLRISLPRPQATSPQPLPESAIAERSQTARPITHTGQAPWGRPVGAPTVPALIVRHPREVFLIPMVSRDRSVDRSLG
jgi:hypothetical protein